MKITDTLDHRKVKRALRKGLPIDDLTDWEGGKCSDGGRYAVRHRLADDGRVYFSVVSDFGLPWNQWHRLDRAARTIARMAKADRMHWYPDGENFPAWEIVRPDGCCVQQYLLIMD